MPDITSQLVAWYKLNETAGTSAADSTGGAAGTYVNSPTLNQSGPWTGAKSVLFTRTSSQYVDIGSKSATASLTVSMWVKRASSSIFRVLHFGKSMIEINSAGTTINWFPDVGGASTAFAGLSLGTGWNHIAITQSGTSATLYINGSSAATNNGITAVSTTSNASYLAVYNSSSNYLDGNMAHVRIYSRALTPDDVAYLYSAGDSTITSILQAPAKTITEVSPLVAANATYPYIFRSRTL